MATQTEKGQWIGTGPFDPAFQQAAELVGKRWSAAVIWAIVHGRHRFADIRNAIPGISDRLLAERLKDLLANGILRHQDEGSDVPGYHLTQRGLALRRVLIALHDWATNRPD
jgi:DNA-binding HxlR family transcriptional regulator